MKSASAKAPGKIIIIGEHAVVNGFPAITSTLNIYSTCRVKRNNNGHVRIIISRFNFEDEYSWKEIFEFTDKVRKHYLDYERTGDFSYMEKIPRRSSGLALMALRESVDYFGITNPPGVTLRGDSDVPVGGFGSSSSAGAAIIESFLKLMEVDYTKSDMYKILFDTETHLLGKVSGLDQTTVLNRGLIYFKKRKEGNLFKKLDIRSPLLNDVFIIDTGRPKNTTGEVVEYVQKQYKQEHKKIQKIFESIEKNTDEVIDALLSNKKDIFFNLIKNTGDELIKLGIVSKDVQNIIADLESLGAYTKISGAGTIKGHGSGSLLCFCGKKRELVRYLKKNNLKYYRVNLGR